MYILCTDKTGTLLISHILVSKSLNVLPGLGGGGVRGGVGGGREDGSIPPLIINKSAL